MLVWIYYESYKNAKMKQILRSAVTRPSFHYQDDLHLNRFRHLIDLLNIAAVAAAVAAARTAVAAILCKFIRIH